MEIIGFFLAILIGFSIGFFGGGGSILAVPVLAYLFLFDEQSATAYSLFIVGITAAFASVKYNSKDLVNWKIASIFGIPSLVGVWLVRSFVIPILPEIIYEFPEFIFTRRMLIFGVFIILMLTASVFMIKNDKHKSKSNIEKINYFLIIFEGLLVGLLTGFVGAGGGFLIVPAIILLTNLDIKNAIGTSLVIIALKSMFGFLFGDALLMNVDWKFLILFSTITTLGMFLGIYTSKYVKNNQLKKAFGYFLILISVSMFLKEFSI